MSQKLQSIKYQLSIITAYSVRLRIKKVFKFKFEKKFFSSNLKTKTQNQYNLRNETCRISNNNTNYACLSSTGNNRRRKKLI